MRILAPFCTVMTPKVSFLVAMKGKKTACLCSVETNARKIACHCLAKTGTRKGVCKSLAGARGKKIASRCWGIWTETTKSRPYFQAPTQVTAFPSWEGQITLLSLLTTLGKTASHCLATTEMRIGCPFLTIGTLRIACPF